MGIIVFAGHKNVLSLLFMQKTKSNGWSIQANTSKTVYPNTTKKIWFYLKTLNRNKRNNKL